MGAQVCETAGLFGLGKPTVYNIFFTVKQMVVRVWNGTLRTVSKHSKTGYPVFEYLFPKRTKITHIFLKMIEGYHFKWILHYS